MSDLVTQPIGYVSVPKRDDYSDTIMRIAMSGSFREFGALKMFNPPSEGERKTLVMRQRTLLDAIGYSPKRDRKQAGAMVSDMLLGYRNAIKPNEKASDVVALYVREIELDPAVPLWALQLACNAIRLGTAPDIDLIFPPSTMALRRLCDSHVWGVRAELGSISDVLRGSKADREVSPEERERIGDGFKALADELRQRNMARASDGSLVSDADLRAMIGEGAWAKLPDAKRSTKAVALGKLANTLAARDLAMTDRLAVKSADGAG